MGNTQGENYEELLERYTRWMKVERDNGERTVKQMRRHTKNFLHWLKETNRSTEDIDQDAVNKYIEHCRATYSKNSLIPVTANLRKFLLHFLKKDLTIKVMKAIASDRDRTALTKDEVRAIFKEAEGSPLAEAVLKTLYYSGARREELIALNIEDVDLGRLKLTIRHGKGDRSRTVNITSDCGMALQRWLSVRPQAKIGHENALFLSSHCKRISPPSVRKIVKGYTARAGVIKDVYIHKFRISMITHMAEDGCTLNEIKAQSGHKCVPILLGYIQHTHQRIRKAYDNVFENINEPLPESKKIDVPQGEDTNYFKKLAFQRYLLGEIDRRTLDTMLSTFEKDENLERDDAPKRGKKDMAYQ